MTEIHKSTGQVALPLIITVGTALAGVFAWTYAQFSTVNAHAAQTDVTVSAVQQKTTDIDTRLTRIENKIDLLISSKIR